MRILALTAVALVLAAPAVAGGRPTASSIETLLVCPVCHETLDQSSAPIAQEMKQEIRRRLAQGWSKQQILDEMVRNFGPNVLSTPAKHGFDLLAWVLPIGGALLGAAVLGAAAWHWSRSRDAGPAPPGEAPLDPEDELLVDEELARF